jgi:thiopeptide-type bacteriocin biosynthesis protein
MILAERLFHADSDAVLDLIETIRENPHADARWRFALAGIDRLLADLGMDVPTRRAIVRGAGDRFGKELRIDDPLERQIGDRYRKERPALESLLGLSLPRDEGLSSAHDFTAFTGRSLVLQPVVAELRQCEQAGRLTQPLVKLAGSFIHMHANRILRSAPREQEFVLYDFLGRLYDSQAARQSAVSKSRVADCF